MKFVYHPRYVFGSRLLNSLHPFEFNRAELAAARLPREYLTRPERAASLQGLSLVHSEEYLASLRYSSVIARVIEVPILSFCPRGWMRKWFLEPALWNTAGSLLAARLALEEGFAMSLGGGFHHAKRSHGEGFCLVNDIAYVVESLRAEKALGTVLYLDLDVHQGNGVSDYYSDDPEVVIMDAYNEDIYPVLGADPAVDVDVPVPLKIGCEDEEYLEAVAGGLARLSDTTPGYGLIIYNAGTDVYREDRLGGLSVTREGVNRRDALVLDFARGSGVPLMVLASGGYSTTSAELLADLGGLALERFGG